MKFLARITATVFFVGSMVSEASPPGLPVAAEKSPLTSFFIQPKRIVWSSEKGVVNSKNLLQPQNGQATLADPHPPLQLLPGGSIVIDFGVEIAGSVELFTTMSQAKGVAVRVRLGESVSEAMAEIGDRGAQNDHAVRDQSVMLKGHGQSVCCRSRQSGGLD